MHRPARAGGSGSWNSWLGSRLHASGFFSSFPPPLPPTHSCRPKTLILPAPSTVSRCNSAWPGALGSPQAVTRAGESEGHRDGRDRVLHCNAVQGALGKPRNGLLFIYLFCRLLQSAGWGRGGEIPHPLPLPPTSSPTLRCHSLRS